MFLRRLSRLSRNSSSLPSSLPLTPLPPGTKTDPISLASLRRPKVRKKKNWIPDEIQEHYPGVKTVLVVLKCDLCSQPSPGEGPGRLGTVTYDEGLDVAKVIQARSVLSSLPPPDPHLRSYLEGSLTVPPPFLCLTLPPSLVPAATSKARQRKSEAWSNASTSQPLSPEHPKQAAYTMNDLPSFTRCRHI